MQANYANVLSPVVNWQHIQIYKRIIKQLEAEGRLETKYKKAVSTILWTLSHWIAKYNTKEARNIVNWIYELVPDFVIPDKGFLGFMYKYVGIGITHKLVRFRNLFY